MAYIKQLPSGLWRAQIDKRGVRDSDTRESKVAVKNWAAAREAEIEADHLAGKKGASKIENITAATLFTTFLKMEGGVGDSAKWNTLRINNWLKSDLAGISIVNIVPHDINVWIQGRQKDVSNATVNRELNLMSSAFRYAVKSKNWLETNPCHGVLRPPKSKPRDRPMLTEDEIQALAITTGYTRDSDLKTLTQRVGACFFLALETGARSGELLRVKPEHYRKAQQTLRIAADEAGGRKTGARDVPLTERATELLDQLIRTMPANQPYVVGLKDTQRDSLWRKARNQAGIKDMHFHDLKHEAATRLAGFIDVIALSHAIGTKDLKILRDVYYNKDAAASAKKLPKKLTPEKAVSTQLPLL